VTLRAALRSIKPRRRHLTVSNEITDEELVELVQRAGDGDLRPFDRLVERHRGRVLANCRYLTRAVNDVEDLAQEVFVKAFFALGRFEGRSTFATWLQRIKINHCINYNEKQRRRKTIDVEDPSLANREELWVRPQAENRLRAMSDRERIVLILESLTDTLRVPLVLRDADGASYREIADALGVSLSAAKMRIKRAREEFRSRWLEAFGEVDLP